MLVQSKKSFIAKSVTTDDMVLIKGFCLTILQHVNEIGPCSYGQFETLYGMSRASVMVFAQRLENAGLVKRERILVDGRSQVVITKTDGFTFLPLMVMQ